MAGLTRTAFVRLEGHANWPLNYMHRHVLRETGDVKALETAIDRRADGYPNVVLRNDIEGAREALEELVLKRGKRRGRQPMRVIDMLFVGPPPYGSDERWSPSLCEQWFEDTLAWVESSCDGWIAVAVGHQDETSPHLHVVMVASQRGELGIRAVRRALGRSAAARGERVDLGSAKEELATVQTAYHEAVGRKYGLGRGKEGSTRRHRRSDRTKAAAASLREARKAKREAAAAQKRVLAGREELDADRKRLDHDQRLVAEMSAEVQQLQNEIKAGRDELAAEREAVVRERQAAKHASEEVEQGRATLEREREAFEGDRERLAKERERVEASQEQLELSCAQVKRERVEAAGLLADAERVRKAAGDEAAAAGRLRDEVQPLWDAAQFAADQAKMDGSRAAAERQAAELEREAAAAERREAERDREAGSPFSTRGRELRRRNDELLQWGNALDDRLKEAQQTHADALTDAEAEYRRKLRDLEGAREAAEVRHRREIEDLEDARDAAVAQEEDLRDKLWEWFQAGMAFAIGAIVGRFTVPKDREARGGQLMSMAELMLKRWTQAVGDGGGKAPEFSMDLMPEQRQPNGGGQGPATAPGQRGLGQSDVGR